MPAIGVNGIKACSNDGHTMCCCIESAIMVITLRRDAHEVGVIVSVGWGAVVSAIKEEQKVLAEVL